MAKKRTKGQLNDKMVFKRLNNLMKDLGRNISIRIGIIGSEAYKKHHDTELTMAELGAIHEFGANINPTDKLKGYFWHRWGIHKSNKQIIIPERSFLRMPLLSKEGKKVLRKAVRNNSRFQNAFLMSQIIIHDNTFGHSDQMSDCRQGK